MPRGISLSDKEKGQIKAYHEEGLSNREISRRLNRSSCVIDNFIKLGDKYSTKKRKGRIPTVTERDKREIKRLALTETFSAKEIRGQMDLGVGIRRVQQIMKTDLNLTYDKKCAKPSLENRHKKARFRFAEKYRFWDEEWKSVVFTDEKKFNFDGPDGAHKYWRDKTSKRENRKRRNFGGGSLMVWAGMAYNGTTPICFVSTRMNSEYYIEILDDVLIEYGEKIVGAEFILQQDNAAIHCSRKTKEFLMSRAIPILDWPALSPDLNPIENLWAILSSKVFHHGRQYTSIKVLKEAIIEEWKKIDLETIQNLVNSMPRRLQEVINNHGGHTSY